MRERSGAATGLGSDSLTGGMGGDYTSWRGAFKANSPNSTRPQAEVQHCRAWFREWRAFAGLFGSNLAAFDVIILKTRSMRGFVRRTGPRPPVRTPFGRS